MFGSEGDTGELSNDAFGWIDRIRFHVAGGLINLARIVIRQDHAAASPVREIHRQPVLTVNVPIELCWIDLVRQLAIEIAERDLLHGKRRTARDFV